MGYPYPTDRDIIRDLQDRYDEELPSCETCKYFRRCKELTRDEEGVGHWRYFHICDVLLHSPEPGEGSCLVVNKDSCCELWTERGEE